MDIDIFEQLETIAKSDSNEERVLLRQFQKKDSYKELGLINQKIIDNPEIVNSDPYGEGWMIKIKILDSNEVEDLLDLKSYEEISG